MVEIIIKGKVPNDPQRRVLAIEAAAKAVCQSAGEDPADAIMALLTAAAHLSLQYSRQPIQKVSETLAYCLGDAIVAADDFFPVKGANDR
ncbi:MAG: hypothetical protein CML24_11685 [Rhizobiales bacterium]|nr:hypothetical protein [Hyphomicrobiales bacterium]|tara:strand:- start:4225 stop:4494 length:270 start_codon:yes stop_codon:yes gene_type:complete